MKFNTVNLGNRMLPDYPYNYRIEILECSVFDLHNLREWLIESQIACTFAGAHVLYLKKDDLALFALKWKT